MRLRKKLKGKFLRTVGIYDSPSDTPKSLSEEFFLRRYQLCISTTPIITLAVLLAVSSFSEPYAL